MTVSKRKAKSPAMASIHEAVSDLHETGLVTTVTMRKFARSCLQPGPEYKAKDVKRLRDQPPTPSVAGPITALTPITSRPASRRASSHQTPAFGMSSSGVVAPNTSAIRSPSSG